MCKHPAADFEKIVKKVEKPANQESVEKKTEGTTMAANKYAGTQTEKNLQEAFAGESQARNSTPILHQ